MGFLGRALTPLEPAELEKLGKGGQPPGTKRLSVALIMLLWLASGLPVAWYCTRVYRSPRFQEAIQAAEAEAGAGEVSFPVGAQIVFVGAWLGTGAGAGSLGNEEELGRAIAGAAFGAGWGAVAARLEPDVSVRFKRVAAGEEEAWGAGDDALDDWLLARGGQGEGYTLYVIEGDREEEAVVFGKHRHAWMRSAHADLPSFSRGGGPEAAGAALRTLLGGGVGPGTAPIPPGGLVLSFTLCVANSTASGHTTWDFEGAAGEHLDPVVSALGRAAGDVAVESQVLGFCRARGGGEGGCLPHESLPFFIDSEWNLGATAAPRRATGHGGGGGGGGVRRRLHFVRYLPAPSECPLLLCSPSGEPSPTGSFTVAAWGGLAIDAAGCRGAAAPAPPAPPAPRHIPAEELAPFMRVAAAQLRELLGLGPLATPPTPGGAAGAARGVRGVPSPAGMAAWEVDALVRREAAGHAREAAAALLSLVGGEVLKTDDFTGILTISSYEMDLFPQNALVQEIPNMVVSEEIVALTERAAGAARAARAAAAAGGGGVKAREAAAKAREAAEAAFFHHSMLPTLYFPTEHLLAIFVPLFLPTVIPILATAAREGKHWASRRRAVREWEAERKDT